MSCPGNTRAQDRTVPAVIPAKRVPDLVRGAGAQGRKTGARPPGIGPARLWIPAFAGMTDRIQPSSLHEGTDVSDTCFRDTTPGPVHTIRRHHVVSSRDQGVSAESPLSRCSSDAHAASCNSLISLHDMGAQVASVNRPRRGPETLPHQSSIHSSAGHLSISGDALSLAIRAMLPATLAGATGTPVPGGTASNVWQRPHHFVQVAHFRVAVDVLGFDMVTTMASVSLGPCTRPPRRLDARSSRSSGRDMRAKGPERRTSAH